MPGGVTSVSCTVSNMTSITPSPHNGTITVLLSALLFHAGSLSWLRHAWQSGTIRPLAGRDTTAEFIRVLSYPEFRLTHDEREDLLGDYLPWCETVLVPNPIEVPDCRNPFDHPFLELALTVGADALLTATRKWYARDRIAAGSRTARRGG